VESGDVERGRRGRRRWTKCGVRVAGGEGQGEVGMATPWASHVYLTDCSILGQAVRLPGKASQ
jgi:hypothetical protein